MIRYRPGELLVRPSRVVLGPKPIIAPPLKEVPIIIPHVQHPDGFKVPPHKVILTEIFSK